MSEATILKALLAVVAVAQVGNGMPIPAHDSNLDQRFPPALPTSNNVEGVFSGKSRLLFSIQARREQVDYLFPIDMA